MPLKPGSSESIKSRNIAEMIQSGHPKNVAVAASLSNARLHPHKQGGGGVASGNGIEHLTTGGFVNSSIPGRTDRIPTNVMADSYVIPADVVSGIGQGNSLAGSHIMDMIFKTGPYGSSIQKTGGRSNIPNSPRAEQPFAKGGTSKHSPVVIAGGEFVVSPATVMRIGNGSMTRGHRALDQFVLRMRKHNIETQSKLPKPKK